jgi:hypothetical protein
LPSFGDYTDWLVLSVHLQATMLRNLHRQYKQVKESLKQELAQAERTLLEQVRAGKRHRDGTGRRNGEQSSSSDWHQAVVMWGCSQGCCVPAVAVLTFRQRPVWH